MLTFGLILTLPGISGTAIGLGVLVVALATLSAAGVWISRLVLALVLLSLGFVRIAIAPRIMGVCVLALVGTFVLSIERHL